jgi:hypothetical protein
MQYPVAPHLRIGLQPVFEYHFTGSINTAETTGTMRRAVFLTILPPEAPEWAENRRYRDEPDTFVSGGRLICGVCDPARLTSCKAQPLAA